VNTVDSSGGKYNLFAATIIDSTTIRIQRSLGGITASVNWNLIEFNDVKSKQTGSFSPVAGTTSVNISITPLNISKSLLYKSIISTDATIFGESANRHIIAYKILDSTTLNFTYSSTGVQSSLTIHWQVIEFN